MNDINELRRLALDGDLAAMQEIILRLKAAEKSDVESLAMYRKARDERDALRAALRHEADCVEAAKAEIEALRAKIEAMEKQEPYSYIYEYANPIDGSPVWRDTPDRWNAQHPRSRKSLYLAPGAQAQPAQKAVAYLDLGVGGYMDVGTDLTDEALVSLPKGRRMLGIVGTYGVDGYVPAQPAPSVPTTLLVAVAELVAQMEIVSRVGFVDTPNDKDSCAAFCVAEGTWLELMSAVESLASALAAAPETKP